MKMPRMQHQRYVAIGIHERLASLQLPEVETFAVGKPPHLRIDHVSLDPHSACVSDLLCRQEPVHNLCKYGRRAHHA